MESIPAMDISPIVFLSENELKQEEKEEIENVVIDMNDISVKDNDYLLVGIFGNGTGYLKATFSEEMKGKGAYKAKFMYQGKDKMKKKVISAELYQIETNSKKVLILLTKLLRLCRFLLLNFSLIDHMMKLKGISQSKAKHINSNPIMI